MNTSRIRRPHSSSGSEEPVTLSWNNPRLNEARLNLYDPYSANNIAALRDRVSPTSPPLESPNYPTEPLVYSFTPISFNSMILLPPAHAPETSSKYIITVNLNVFMPSSYITTIRRGTTDSGEYVGDFEMGISAKPGTFCIRGKEFLIGDVLGKSGSRQAGLWDWKFVNKGLFWDCSTSTRTCWSKDHSTLYAKFRPATAMRVPSLDAELTQLEMMPVGHPYFDDILLSALIIERWRLTPASGNLKQLFS